MLRPLAFSSAEQSPVTVFSRLQAELRIFEKAGTGFLECYFYALELLREAESTNEISSLKEAAALLCSIAENKTAEERCISLTENENRVHIANLHKVKGLEAPVVILALPAKNDNSPDYRVADTPSGRKNWIFSFSKFTDNGYKKNLFSTESFPDELELEKECLEAERIRLLYVAATRARSALIVGQAIKSDGSPAKDNPWAALIDEDAQDILPLCGLPKEPPEESVTSKELYITQADTVFADRSSQEKTYEIKRPSMLAVKAKTSSEDELEDADAESADKSRRREDAALTGTVVHRLMELIVTSKDKMSRDNLVNEIVSDFGLTDEKYPAILSGVYDRIHSGGYEQSNGIIKDILPELLSADEVYCEVPFCSEEPGEGTAEIWNGVMDVVYRKGEKWHIVDYKTNGDADDLDEKYKAQLNAYISAFGNMTGCAADALIYHIDV